MKAIILAYKEHEDMRSATPVYLHDILDKPIIDYAISHCNKYDSTVVVNEAYADKYAKQAAACQVTTTTNGDTVFETVKALADDTDMLIIDGNVPSLDNYALEDFLEGAKEDGGKIVTLEQKNAEYTLIYLASGTTMDEYDSFESMLNNKNIVEFEIPEAFQAFSAIHNRLDLTLAEDFIRENIIHNWLYNGVTIKNMASVTLGPDVEIGQDTIIFPNSYITGKVKIGENCKLGPFIRIRQAATLANGVKIGNFVELKNASMGEKSASAHLSYLGDCTIGKAVNVGCGVITVNYDGANKHHTTIEDDAFIGCNVNLVAPITVGESSLVAAGSTVTKDIPAKNLSFARARQVNKGDYERKRKQK